MRTLLAAALTALPLLLVATDLAQAQNYPWCVAGSYKDGARSCIYQTFAQCRASASGGSTYCEPNPMYRPGLDDPSAPRRPRR